MEKEIKIIEKELIEINKMEQNMEEEVVTFSSYCGGTLTLICC